MAHVRVFYGHEGIVRPHGPSARSASVDEAAVEEIVDDEAVDETAAETVDEVTGEAPVDETPSARWTVEQIDAWAAERGIDVSGTKAEKLATISEAGDASD